MMGIFQFRNIRVTFLIATIDAIIWLLVAFVSQVYFSIPIATIALLIPISRFVLRFFIFLYFRQIASLLIDLLIWYTGYPS